MTLSPRDQSLPVLETVDLLIFGGTLAAVEAALRAASAGKTVFLVGGRSYLGEDVCGKLQLWPEAKKVQAATALTREVFPAGEPATPMHVKLTLEQALVKAGVGFVLLSYPAGVLRNDKGAICGGVLSNRSGRQVVEASMVLDATTDGLFAEQAGYHFEALKGEQTVRHVTLCNGDGQDAEGIDVVARPDAFNGISDKKEWKLTPRIYELRVDLGDGSAKDAFRAQAEVVERTWVGPEYCHQECLSPVFEHGFEPSVASDFFLESGLMSFACQSSNKPRSLLITDDSIQAARWAEQFVLEGLEGNATGDTCGCEVTCAGSETITQGEIKTLANPLRSNRSADRSLSIAQNDLPLLGDFDVVVVGGGTGGAPAAIGAARSGARTAVIELAPALGGVGTVGQISRYWYGNRVGFTAEIDASVADLEVDSKYRRGKGAWSTGAKAEWYHRECFKNDVSLWFRTVCIGAWVVEGRVCGLVVAGPGGYGLLKAGCVVDSSGCADIPAAVGAPTHSIGAEHVAVQGTGLAGHMPGREYHNSDHNFSDDTDLIDSTAFFVASKLKCKNDFDAGQLIDSRERRQIDGEFTLEPKDFMYERRFPDTICVASSNFDTHGFTVHPLFMIKPPHEDRLWVDVPFRCLLPQGIERILVTGLGVSAHRDVLPVIRMQPDVQNQGYAAGLIAAKAALSNTDLRDLNIREIQKELVAKGNLPERVLTDEDNFSVDNEELYRCVYEKWDDFAGLSLIISEKERVVPILREALAESSVREQRLRYAEILGFFGCDAGREILEEAIQSQSWDDGWNYTGMGQFGMSMSPLDTAIVALGHCGNDGSWGVILDKIRSLSSKPDFSHCRAVVLAAETLYRKYSNFEVGEALFNVLEMEGMSGHAQSDIAVVQNQLTEDLCETSVRNRALTELHLARGLFRCGNYNGLGERVLREFAEDCRGHFARHAHAVIMEKAEAHATILQNH